MSGALSPADRQRLDTLFERAAELPPTEHAAFVARECASNGALRDELARLLAGLAGEDVLGRLQPGHPLRAGTVIDRYKLLERVGQGGMGEVYAAEQQEPVARRVALKIIKAGMDSAEVVARFHAERQALARMSHPNIAQVFDAGTTADGRPYFVMEFVAGDPLTEYCDRRRLAMRARLELFLLVCEGVQHAHQKGIIHRDLKPSNLLVVQQDGRALPKIIDFGVARATSGRLTERTLHTMLGQIVGTLDYMSPEQADPTSVDLDTRSDIYSLGVVLYQLACGLLPFEHESSAGTPLSEIVRTIREADPPTPSTRLKRQTGTATAIAALHGTDERALVHQLSGDLDWICLKALEKDPARRYASASELAEDVRRHLAHEPVLAGRPGTLYRAKKYVRRHRVGVTAGVLVGAATVAGTIGTVSGRLEAAKQSIEAKVQGERVLEAELRERAESVRSGRLSDAKNLEERVAEAAELWPPHPGAIPALMAWLDSARALRDKLPDHCAKFEALRGRALAWTDAERQRDHETHPKAGELAQKRAELLALVEELERSETVVRADERIAALETEVVLLEEVVQARRTWNFSSTEDQWQHGVLSALVANLETLDAGLLAEDSVPMEHGWSVPKRLAFAQALLAGFDAEYAQAWSDALPEIRAAYPGLDLGVQMGLVPLGPDPDSGLWEFAHLQSGKPALRAANGKLVLEDGTGIVLVLLPGGTFWMGAQGSDPQEPNYDPWAIEKFEAPKREAGGYAPVSVEAFFLSKFEMTQGQWEHVMGSKPSFIVKPLLPVNQVTARQCDTTMKQLGLSLPDEGQWEYAARAGTTSVWWTGNDTDSLEGAANLFDETMDKSKPEWRALNEGLLVWTSIDGVPISDGFPNVAPVDSFAANPFGLHNVHGNVMEVCSNGLYDYRDGHPIGPKSINRIARGGDFRSSAGSARCARRNWGSDQQVLPQVGLRPARAIEP